jgi:hypothetical protein
LHRGNWWTHSFSPRTDIGEGSRSGLHLSPPGESYKYRCAFGWHKHRSIEGITGEGRWFVINCYCQRW